MADSFGSSGARPQLDYLPHGVLPLLHGAVCYSRRCMQSWFLSLVFWAVEAMMEAIDVAADMSSFAVTIMGAYAAGQYSMEYDGDNWIAHLQLKDLACIAIVAFWGVNAVLTVFRTMRVSRATGKDSTPGTAGLNLFRKSSALSWYLRLLLHFNCPSS